VTPRGPDRSNEADARVDGVASGHAGDITRPDDTTAWDVTGRSSDRALWAGRPGGSPAWERDLDALVSPVLLTEPPAAVQQAILAAVLAAAAPAPVPIMAAVPATPLYAPAQVAPPRPLSMAAYLLVAAVLVAYVAAMSWVQGAFGGGAWLATLFAQLLAVSELVVGRPAVGEPLTVAWLLLQRAPWLLLLPIGWLLWERDRASTRMV
jgi:hypothetical protein